MTKNIRWYVVSTVSGLNGTELDNLIEILSTTQRQCHSRSLLNCLTRQIFKTVKKDDIGENGIDSIQIIFVS